MAKNAHLLASCVRPPIALSFVRLRVVMESEEVVSCQQQHEVKWTAGRSDVPIHIWWLYLVVRGGAGWD